MLFSGLMIPFVGTTLGAAAVFLMKNKINKKAENLLLGFASGVMLAASFFSLILVSIEMSEGYRLKFIPASAGFMIGIISMMISDKVIRKTNSVKRNTAMLIFAVTLHNIPEGMAVGVTLAAALNNNSDVTVAAAMALATGIAIQNFPEGAIISMPLKSEGKSKLKSFLAGTASGVVEPIFGFITILLTGAVSILLPYLLSFAAGAMIYVVADELLPEAKSDGSSYLCMTGLSLGFVVMMILDVAFG